jgi:hypothetical protein
MLKHLWYKITVYIYILSGHELRLLLDIRTSGFICHFACDSQPSVDQEMFYPECEAAEYSTTTRLYGAISQNASPSSIEPKDSCLPTNFNSSQCNRLLIVYNAALPYMFRPSLDIFKKISHVIKGNSFLSFFPCDPTAQFWALVASMKLSVHFSYGWSARRKVSANCPEWLWWWRSLRNETVFGRGNRSTRRKPPPTPLFPPHIPLARPGRGG